MTRYMLDKAMWEIDQSDANLASFKEDRARFLAEWEGLTTHPHPLLPLGGVLTVEERLALESLDLAKLYSMGAHPFLLWQLARSVWVPDEMDIDELIEHFRDAVEPLGRPDFST